MLRNIFHFVAVTVVLGWIGISTQLLADDVRVKDLPIPEGATEISYLKRRGDVRFQMESDFKTVGSFYVKKLTELKWTKSGRDNLQSSFQVQTFAKGNVSLEVRVSSRGSGSEVRLTPKGMMWEEDDQPTPKDLPLPADATEIEYDDFFESIEFKSPSELKTIVEFLSKELEQRKWTKAATEFDLATFVRMKFTQQKSTLDIDVRAEDTGCEVAIRTKGMQWDGMKAEIEKAEEEAEKIAAEEKERTANTPLSLRERKDKPKQGIGDLPKLPNEGTVVMDGKTIKLTHLIAYEVFENDEWSTKIVATQKPIKQETLLARLKKTGTDNDEDESPPNWPQPWLLVVVDEVDRPWRLNLLADGTPGGSSGDELNGTALVEDGRARGTVAMIEPDSFFEKVYTAEISFDVPVLTRDSTAAKRLADAPRLTNSGKLTIGNRTYNLANVVGYRMRQFDEPMTTIVFSEKPLNMTKLKASLGKEAADNYFEFTPQVTLLVDADDNVSSLSIWADNSSISSSGNTDLEGDIVIEDGRARGTARLAEPGEFSDKTYHFEVSFDVDVLGTQLPSKTIPEGGLAADAWDGLPIPEGHEGMQSEGSRFRKQGNTTVAAELSRVVDFYRRELPSGKWGEWKESAADAKVDQQTARLAFSGPTGSLIVQLEGEDGNVAITLVSRDARAAKEAGLLPAAGKSRLLVGNTSDNAAVITINKQEYKVAAGAGARDPKTGLNWEVAPGNYTVEMKPAGEPVQSEKLQLGPDETWGVIIGEFGGYLAIQLY